MEELWRPAEALKVFSKGDICGAEYCASLRRVLGRVWGKVREGWTGEGLGSFYKWLISGEGLRKGCGRFGNKLGNGLGKDEEGWAGVVIWGLWWWRGCGGVVIWRW